VSRGLTFTLLALLVGSNAEAAARIVPADLKEVLAAIRKPGAAAVLVNVWATWCEPCRAEMPELVRFYRAHRRQRLRLVLVSADDAEARGQAEKFLASQGVDFQSYLKVGDDMQFIDGLDKRWTGALPASFLFDGKGELRQFWPGPITRAQLDTKLQETLQRRNKP
jgi:thiol-disulfide isomerase/thioredoxin